MSMHQNMANSSSVHVYDNLCWAVCVTKVKNE